MLLESLMGSPSLEIGHIGMEHSVELRLMENQQLIKAFSSHASQEALTTGIGTRGLGGRFEYLDS